ncbi:MAG: helical backbone metal receptor [Synergistaceae bacterium]|jgi:iron complex transport system substrate-binding protein|nr:helical backbone metal receptor [Synergistaceae bacterium]
MRVKRLALFFILFFLMAASGQAAERIVSMSPAATEILFSLSLGDRLIGVTRFCDYPPEANKIPRVADMLDISLETLLDLTPDLVVLVDLNASLRERIERLGIATFVLRQETLGELCDSIEELGRVCSVPEKGKTEADSLRGALAEADKLTAGLGRPRVAVAVDRDITDPVIRSLYIAGKESFYDEMIRLAGGRNAFETWGVTYPKMSAEGLIGLDPDVIIDLVGDHRIDEGVTQEDLKAQWRSVPELKALKEGRIHLLMGNYALRPGPRVVRALFEFMGFIHPELLPEIRGKIPTEQEAR